MHLHKSRFDTARALASDIITNCSVDVETEKRGLALLNHLLLDDVTPIMENELGILVDNEKAIQI